MDNTSDYRSEDSRFNSWLARLHLIFCGGSCPAIGQNFEQILEHMQNADYNMHFIWQFIIIIPTSKHFIFAIN